MNIHGGKFCPKCLFVLSPERLCIHIRWDSENDRCTRRRRSVSRKLRGQDQFRIALKRLWALLGRPRIDVCVEDGGLDVGFADVRYFGTISPLISLPLSFFYFGCVLVLLKLASHGAFAADS
jgi:hypothetical protein